jgi:hypothetical protein
VDGGNWSFAGNTVEANQLGTSANPATVESDSITNSGQVTTASLDSDSITNSGQVETQSLDAAQVFTPGFETDQYVHADNFNTLQDAVDAAESNPPRKGVFLGTGKFDPVETTVSLISTDRGFAGDYSGPIIENNGTDPGVQVLAADLTISGIKFNGKGTNQPAIKVNSSDSSEIDIRKCNFDDFGSSVIVLNGSGAPQITGCRFRTFNTGTDIVLGSNTEKGVVNSCTPFKSPNSVSVSDSGSGNVIGDVS